VSCFFCCLCDVLVRLVVFWGALVVRQRSGWSGNCFALVGFLRERAVGGCLIFVGAVLFEWCVGLVLLCFLGLHCWG